MSCYCYRWDRSCLNSRTSIVWFYVPFLIFSLIIMGRATILSNKYLVYLGGISYALYLTHQNIGYIIIRYFYTLPVYPLVGIAVALFTIVLLASILTFAIEKPALNLLRAYYKKSSALQEIGKKTQFFSKN
jgi:peptidoglycan/LPS O-acetylase OafA/YrhL